MLCRITSQLLLLSQDIINPTVHWEDMGREEGIQIPYSGMPFIVLGYYVRECHFSPNSNVAIKYMAYIKWKWCRNFQLKDAFLK